MVVQDDEVAHVFHFGAADVVVEIDQRRGDAVERKQLDQAYHGADGEVDAGRLQRLDEAAGQAQRYHVLAPGLQPSAGTERYQPWILDGRRTDVLQQLGPGFVVG